MGKILYNKNVNILKMRASTRKIPFNLTIEVIPVKHELKEVLFNNKSWLILAIIFFLLGIATSLLINNLDQSVFDLILEEQKETLENLARSIFTGHPLVGTAILFFHNLTTILWLMLSGFFLGLFPLLGLYFNGSLLGFVALALSAEGINPLSVILLGVMPHGIFELPAFFMGAALGLKMGFHLVFPLTGKGRWESFKHILREMIFLLPFLIMMLVLAAFIEIFITPHLLGMVIS